MANYAALIDVLTIAGSRLSTGEPNSSGTVYFFQPGGNTPVNVYSDAAASTIVTQPLVLTSGGLVNIATVPNGIYVTQPVRVLIQDVSGNTVADTVYIPATAGDVGVSNAGWTGDNLDDVLTAIYTSVGGQDGQYLIANGQTELSLKSAITGIAINVKAFGAVGDGVAIDTTAIQNALNYAKAASGGVVLFPPGTYLIDQALTLSSATGVSLQGAGVSASKIITSHASANVFTFTSCTSTIIQGLGISATGTNSASAISLATCTRATLRELLIDTSGGGTFLIPIVSSSSAILVLENCQATAKSGDATARTLKLTSVSSTFVLGGFYSGDAGAAMEFAGTTSNVRVVAARFGNSSANIGMLWTTGMTGTDFTVVGCPTLRSSVAAFTTPFDLSALATDPRLRQWGNEVDGYATNVLTGATVTPDRSRGPHIKITGTTTGSAYVVAAPTPVPTTTMRDVYLRLTFYNNASGAVTGWTMNAAYHLSAGPSTTDTQQTSYTLLWDPDASVWREFSRVVTT